MNNFNKFFKDNGMIIIIVILLLFYIKSCNIHSDVEKTQTQVNSIEYKIDSLTQVTIDEDEMVDIIKDTPAWKTLRLEEISDKEHISINVLEEKEKE